MGVIPILPTPFGDLGWVLMPGYAFLPEDDFCTNIQLKFLDCLEAYGLGRGKTKCAELYFDVQECQFKMFQKNRAEFIRKERMKQYREGKIDKPFDEHPPLDSYMYLK